MTGAGGGVEAPTRSDPVAAALSARLGGPAGDHGRPHWWWTPVRILLAVLTIVFAMSLVQRAPCIDTHWNSTSVRYSKMCYSDIPYLYTGRGFAEQQWPYTTAGRYPAMEYPVGISYLAWFAAEVTALAPQGPPEALRAAAPTEDLWGMPGMDAEINEYFLATALLLFLCALAAAYFLAGAHRRRPWDALPFVLSPALLLTGLVNWDLLAVAFTAGALWAWARGKPLLAGVFVGLGTASKLYPLFLLGAFLVVCLRRRRIGWFGWAAAGAAVAWTLVQVPAWLGDLDRWQEFWVFNSRRSADLGSPWIILSQHGHAVGAHGINITSWVLFGGACVAILVLGMRAAHPPRVAQVAFLVVAAFLLVNKVYSPQYVLWLLPLAVLARPRWRDLLIWQAGEVCYFAMVWMYLGGWLAPGAGSGAPTYQLAIVVRVLAELYLVAMVVRDILAPEHDPAREGALDSDPMTPELSAAG